jgi:hypothetical protein
LTLIRSLNKCQTLNDLIDTKDRDICCQYSKLVNETERGGYESF